MKRINLQNDVVPFLAGALLTVLMFLALSRVDHERFLYKFFFRSWYVQAVTTWLFGAAMAFVILRFYHLRDEVRILNRKVGVERLGPITPQRATELQEAIPAKYQNSIGFRRIGELLRAYLYGEEIVRLNQELSRRDTEQIETGHLVLNALRQLIPILGFLGTVVGLSMGMVRFPEISQAGASIEALRSVLKDFAASLSVAFDTTLLALGYSVIVVLVSSILRHKEETFVTEVDNKARLLISKLSPVAAARVDGVGGDHEQLLRRLTQEFAASLRQNGEAVVAKLDELKNALQQPPRYEIIVQPMEGNRHE